MKKAEQLKIIKNIIGLSVKGAGFNYNLYTKNAIVEFKKGKEKYLCIYNGFSILCIPRSEVLLSDAEIQDLKDKMQRDKKYIKDFTFTLDVIKYYTQNKTKALKADVDIDKLKEIINSNEKEKIYTIDYILDRDGKPENKKMLLNATILFDLINISNAKIFTLSSYLLSLEGYCHLFFCSEDKRIFGILVSRREKPKK